MRLRRFTASHIAYALFIAIVTSGCDFTEVGLPDSQLAAQAVFEDKATADAAMADVYARMRDNSMLSGNAEGLSFLLGNYTDELDFYGSPQNSAVPFYNNALVVTNSTVKTLWDNAYGQVYAANAVLEGATASQSLLEADRRRLQGEALFVRGLLHLYLTSVFGDVPYVTTTDYQQNRNVSKLIQANVYLKIKEDLYRAIESLPEAYTTPDRTRPNKYAAYALLARVALYAGDDAGASDAASAVLNNTGLYNYGQDVAGMFLLGNPANIWQFSPSGGGGNSLEAITFSFTSGPPPLSALTASLANNFEPGDLRRQEWVGEVSDGMTTWYRPYKYREESNTGASQEYSIVLRLGEMYLIRAEARLRAGDLIGGKEDLDIIRAKAGLPPTTAITQEGLLAAVLNERRAELFTEFGHRFFDLRRFGQLDAVLAPAKNGWTANDALFPLPDAELNLNPNLLPQNTGY